MKWMFAHLVAALCSPVWQKRKRTSFSVLEKAYLADILLSRYFRWWVEGWEGQLRVEGDN